MAPIPSERLLAAVGEQLGPGTAPGAVLAVSDNGQVLLEAVGNASLEGQPMTTDAVFRISSMTKPLVAVLTLMLVDEGVLTLNDPVDRWLPELADRRVLRRLDGPVNETVPAERAITVEDLLTMRMGFGFAFEVASCPVAEAADARGLGMGPPLPSAVAVGPDEWIARFGELPLMEHPGSAWRYDLAYAVLGVLLARAGEQPLGELLADRVLSPLGMGDTGFAVPDQARLVPCYTADGSGGLAVFDPAKGSDWSTDPLFPHAGGGLASTASNYLRFAEFMLAGGAHEGKRLLSVDAFRAMTTDQLTPAQHSGSSAEIFLDGAGWGYGVQVSPTRYGWGGGLGTTWFNYPDRHTAAILLTQCLPPPEPLLNAFWSSLDS
ncbi:CubicO group peptidase (beta-lactamase class C family) [Kribbella orskensis]|uniref:CubicO group peptidase (Beta-lactamase class C family) n=1 Tax=Kribbella orskensis TaxID=2512216 RepID=A0ABY2BPY8_9ACTN|nr:MULTISPECIES: serine hydrolase domain-containing protein [Kribbella]TCN39859.1 CubicO group peptidase (beta-lactamase class C family) [Kribbella sp. VKM Ac-2500]TCO27358.1 CubicO group peptidase (beta-lactamase class C family) [Kribbella orskensis]